MKYYIELAKELEKMGSHILAIKDMAGLCKPEAARRLVRALRQEIGIPIHFHTHDTAGIQAASILAAADEKLEIADVAFAPLSGGTSQVNLNTIVEALRDTPRDTGLDTDALTRIAVYWQAAREFYTPFETLVLPATGDLYEHEMPGGQYTNLYQQAKALGLADRWAEICKMYAEVNRLLGDIVKVTPTSKAVGDLALFMVAGDLTSEDVLRGDRNLAFPQSVIDLVGGRMGQPPGGFPPRIIEVVMQGAGTLTTRPGETLPPANIEAARTKAGELLEHAGNDWDASSYLLYPKVFEEYAAHVRQYGDVGRLPTPNFFYGQQPGEEIAVDIEAGKRLIIKYLATGQPYPDGTRTVFFELNGQPREVTVVDRSLEPETKRREKADTGNPAQIGASMPGMVIGVAVKEGDRVKPGHKLIVLEAMKMEATINAPHAGIVDKVCITKGSQVEAGDLLLVITPS